MGKINVLSFAVANLIAAGEVVDRPASVIKELLENSIDSGADRITVEIQNGGVTFMCVSDNGCGIEPDDLPVAIRRHATSKIKDAADLDGIMTLGFRGEALAAIAAVSHMRIISRVRGADCGAMLEASGGDIIRLSERACSDGTTVIVEDLFANVPARRKFLKKNVTEATAVCAAVEKIALSKPGISFRLIVDGSIRLETVGDGNLKNAIYSVFGKEFASKLIPAQLAIDGIEVNGFIGRSDNVRPNRNYQNYFINGRYVRSKTASAAVEQAYTSYIPPEKFPCCVLYITINPAAVDVNVHPAKLEVKFSNEKPVFEAVYYAVRNALEENVTRPDLKLFSSPASTLTSSPATLVSESETPITDGGGESLRRRQLAAEVYVANKSQDSSSEGATAADAGGKSGTGGRFAHMTAEEYVREYVGENTNRNTAGTYSRSYTDISAATGVKVSSADPADGKNITSPQTDAGKDNSLPCAHDSVTPGAGSSPYSGSVNISDASPDSMKNGVTEEAPENKNITDARPEALSREVVAGENAAVNHYAPSAPDMSVSLNYRIVGEVFNSYVIVENGDRMLIIDKHAAHERIIFEQLKAGMHSSHAVVSQLLMLPVEVMMTSDEVAAITDYRKEIEAVGFEFTAGKNTVSISALPEGISPDAAGDMLTVMAERIRNNTGNVRLTRDIVFEKALYQASCKAAIKAGREYPPEYVKWIVDKLMQIPDITFCPHGRPVAMELSHKKLDHQFERS